MDFFLQNIKVGGGKKIKIKITKKSIFTVQDHTIFLFFIFFKSAIFYIGGNKKVNFFLFFFLKCKHLGRRFRKPRNKKKIAQTDKSIRNIEYKTTNTFAVNTLKLDLEFQPYSNTSK